MREPRHVRVDNHTGLYMERFGQDDVRRLRATPGTRATRPSCAEPLRDTAQQPFRGALDRLRLVAKEAGRLNVFLELTRWDLQIVLRLPVLAKQVGGHDVDAFIGTLRGQNRRNEQLKRVRVVERTLGVG